MSRFATEFRSSPQIGGLLNRFRSSGNKFNLYLFPAENGMCCGETDNAGLLLGPNPDGTGTADNCKRIVANQFRRTLDLQLESVVGSA